MTKTLPQILSSSRFWGEQSQFTQVTPRVVLWSLLYISSPWLGQEWEEWQLCPSGSVLGIRGISMLLSGVRQTPVGSYHIWELPLWAVHRGSHVKAAACKWVLMVSKNKWNVHACVSAKSLQSCPTLCDPVDYSLPGSSVHEILQARILEWVAISVSKR